MTPLPLQFHRSTFIYLQVCRFGDVALYRKRPAFAEGQEKLEVVRPVKAIKCPPLMIPKNQTSEASCPGPHERIPFEWQETYPLPGDYGKHLWEVSSEAEAFGLMSALLLA